MRDFQASGTACARDPSEEMFPNLNHTQDRHILPAPFLTPGWAMWRQRRTVTASRERLLSFIMQEKCAGARGGWTCFYQLWVPPAGGAVVPRA